MAGPFLTDAVVDNVYSSLVLESTDAGAETVVVNPGERRYGAGIAVTGAGDETTIVPASKTYQRIAYEAAVVGGFDPDQPLGLSKHVDRSTL